MDIFDDLFKIKLDEQTFILAVIFVATMLLILTIALIIIGTRSPVQRKLDAIRKDMGGLSLKKSNKLGYTLESIAPIVAPRNRKDRESARHQLMHAGFHDANALTMYYAIKVFSAAIGIFSASSFYLFMPTLSHLNIVMIACVALGMYAPNIVLGKLVNKRKQKVRAGVPDALDLLVVCTESGLGFNASLRRVADEVMISHPDFADELDTVCAKINAGVQMVDAFENLVERTGVVEISGLVHMLAHAARIGGSLSQTLREYTEDYRDRRNQEVEEIAAKIPTKMIFPLLLFIWPCFFIVAIGPSILSITANLGQ